MNEQIKQLSKQAHDFAVEQTILGLATHAHRVVFEKKFSELIIQECTSILSTIDRAQLRSGEYVDPADMIRKHFGFDNKDLVNKSTPQAPQPRRRLTDEEIDGIQQEWIAKGMSGSRSFARAIEDAVCGEKGAPQPKADPQEPVANELKSILLFLLGDAPLNGLNFGERRVGQGEYWWRTHLRKAMESPEAPQPKAEQELYLKREVKLLRQEKFELITQRHVLQKRIEELLEAQPAEQEPVDDIWFEDNNGAKRNTPKDCQRFDANGVPAAVWVNGICYTEPQPAIPHRWTPTAKNINALPEPIRSYIADLETNADPAGTVRDLTIARDTIKALEASNRMLRDAAPEAPQPKAEAPTKIKQRRP